MRKSSMRTLFQLLIVVIVLAEDDLFDDEVAKNSDEDFEIAASANVRKVRLIDDGDAPWRNAQNIPQEQDGQTPSEQDSMRPLQKRRRLRKRKRRPFLDEQGELVRRRRRRPVRLDEADDGWKEMAAESPPRIYSRRRSGPIFDREDLKVRVTIEQKESQGNAPTSSTLTTLQDIKDILKQAGGLSLSEILLQKNLTLNDLLSGSHNAISALSERPGLIATTRPSEEIQKLSNEEKKRSEMVDATDVSTKYDWSTEANREKRIFVPSHPKYYTAINFRPEFELITEAPQIAPKTTKRLPMTSAQMNLKVVRNRKYATTPNFADVTTTQRTESNPGPLKMSFNLDDLAKDNVVETASLGERSSLQIDLQTTTMPTTREDTTLQELLTAETTKNFDIGFQIGDADDRPTTAKLVTTQKYASKWKYLPTTQGVPQEVLEPKKSTQSAKEEIMEVMSNKQAQSELAQVLNRRNMTIDELVEQRERGSSQRHLAEIFQNSHKEPELNSNDTFAPNNTRQAKQYLTVSIPTTTSSTTTTTTTSPTTIKMETTSDVDRRPLEDISMSNEEVELLDIKPNTIPSIPSTSFPTYKIEMHKGSKDISPLHIPIWKTIYPSIYIEPERNEQELQLDAIEESIRQVVDSNSIAHSNRPMEEYDDYIQLPTGVKSALFASLAIIGMSLVVFLTILAIFRWTQKHRQRLCYADTSATSSGSNSIFTSSKIKTPILQHEQPRRSIRTFVSETLGKSRNFYAQHYRQSMSDTWENSERPYQ